jgi:hypothetical protein
LSITLCCGAKVSRCAATLDMVWFDTKFGHLENVGPKIG